MILCNIIAAIVTIVINFIYFLFIAMISIKKTYTLYKNVLDDILYITMAHKLTTYGFFYYPKLISDKKDIMVFECAVTDEIRKKQLIEKCIQLLNDWDGTL